MTKRPRKSKPGAVAGDAGDQHSHPAPPSFGDAIDRLAKEDPEGAKQLLETMRLQMYGWPAPTEEFWRSCGATGGRTPVEMRALFDKHYPGFLAATEAATPAPAETTEPTGLAEPVAKKRRPGPPLGVTNHLRRKREALVPALQDARQPGESLRGTIEQLSRAGEITVPGAGDAKNNIDALARVWSEKVAQQEAPPTGE